MELTLVPPTDASVVSWERRALMNCRNVLNESLPSIKILKPLLSHCGLVAMEKFSPGSHSNQTPMGDRPQMGWFRAGIREGVPRPEPRIGGGLKSEQLPTSQPRFLKITQTESSPLLEAQS